MKKLLCSLLFLFFSLFLFNQTAFAADDIVCELTTNPTQITTSDTRADLTISSPDLPNGHTYWLRYDGGKIGSGKDQDFTVVDHKIIVTGMDGGKNTGDFAGNRKFESGTHDITVTEQGIDFNWRTYCTAKLIIPGNPSTNKSCNIQFINEKFTTDDEIKFRVDGLWTGDSNQHHYVLRKPNKNGDTKTDHCPTKQKLSTQGESLGKLQTGTYYLEIRDDCRGIASLGESLACYVDFRVVRPGETGGVLSGGGGVLPPMPPPCSKFVDENNNEVKPNDSRYNDPKVIKHCAIVNTGLGIPISTDPAGFIKSLFGILLSVAGGVALLLIIFAGYKLMTSQGNPENIQGAKETLTSAIIGLLFIIFSMVILQIIGVNILQIPGFK